MVIIGLQINASLENIEELKTCYPNYPFFVKVKCSNCGEESNKWHDITESETVRADSKNTRGFNFFMKCALCNRENSVDIIAGSNDVYNSDNTGHFKTIVKFDCRGMELTAFLPKNGWLVRSIENGTKFEDVDLSKDDWVEYDEINGNSIGVYEFKSQFIKLKK